MMDETRERGRKEGAALIIVRSGDLRMFQLVNMIVCNVYR